MKFCLVSKFRHFSCVFLMGMVGVLLWVGNMQAKRVSNTIAVFSGLDKITGRTTRFEVPIDRVYQFGALQVTPRICYTSSEDEPARPASFIEVNEVTLDKKTQRIFTGWIFADSPGLNAVEHPIYDVWLKDCK
ncbi:DUF2155 domain-containing protein [Bartonella bacilliformis]|uniref:Cellulase-like protein n=3 Tax=Bartonella bacilliformis TaxID=774 RepID=A1USB6_BARBK|nr:DUF2155 domain-containing protein [Bartonella bacilliformis]ABM45125.1 conserved hypothetical protein [Bartonella bacilliformis KC583]AMG86325.1 DUF2155 domain-containing protein [Bartonella bacilliformis]KZM38017.1 hypothetical protein AWH67_02100 [Bartonella bacilliformis]KZN22072.1 hypothetical protein A6B38_01925 [Bartonella bacilliformis]QFZ90278.1 DUF2155 domain-containing protein [Bartonella bacilliformis]